MLILAERPLLLALAGALLLAGCGGPADPIPCYPGGRVPDGALLFDCAITVGCGFECEGGDTYHELVAAPDAFSAEACLREFSGEGVRVSCEFYGISRTDPGGGPNAIAPEA